MGRVRRQGGELRLMKRNLELPVNPKKRTEITVETERILVIRRRYRAIEVWCDSCAEQVVMIRPDQAAAVSGQSLRAIFGDIERAALHFIEQPDGMLLICLNSLLKRTREETDSRSQAASST
jgi:hypothetical protein